MIFIFYHKTFRRSSEKRVTAVSISHDGLFVCLADKFGVVWVVDLNSQGENQCPVDKSASPLLGHYCSIITSLVCLHFSSILLTL